MQENNIDKRPKYSEPKLKKDGTPDKRFLRRKEGYELPYGQRPQRKAWYEKNKEKRREYNKEYREKNKETLTQKKYEYLVKVKKEGIEEYGGKCHKCGETDFDSLTMHHINGKTDIDKKHGGRWVTGKKMFQYLKSLNWPQDNYELLCWDCHLSHHIKSKQKKNDINLMIFIILISIFKRVSNDAG